MTGGKNESIRDSSSADPTVVPHVLSPETYARGASAIGVPGWPESAFCTASLDRTRIALNSGPPVNDRKRTEWAGRLEPIGEYERLRCGLGHRGYASKSRYAFSSMRIGVSDWS